VDVQLKPDIPDRSGPDQHEPIIFDGNLRSLRSSACFILFRGLLLWNWPGRIWTHLDASGRIWTHLEALGGIGLTVALFVANEAFVQPEMRGQATGPS